MLVPSCIFMGAYNALYKCILSTLRALILCNIVCYRLSSVLKQAISTLIFQTLDAVPRVIWIN